MNQQITAVAYIGPNTTASGFTRTSALLVVLSLFVGFVHAGTGLPQPMLFADTVGAVRMLVSSDYVWALNVGRMHGEGLADYSIVRIDPRSNQVSEGEIVSLLSLRIVEPRLRESYRLCAGAEAIWLAVPSGIPKKNMKLIKFDAATLGMEGTTKVRGGVACAGTNQALWVMSRNGLVRVDPATLEPSKPIPLPEKTSRRQWRSLNVAVDADAVWISDSSSVYRVNPESGEIMTLVPLNRREDEAGWRELLVTPEHIWVLDEPNVLHGPRMVLNGLGRISRVHRKTGEVDAWEFEGADTGWLLRAAAVTEEGIWIPTVTGYDSLTLVDPATGNVRREMAIGHAELYPQVGVQNDTLWYLADGVYRLSRATLVTGGGSSGEP